MSISNILLADFILHLAWSVGWSGSDHECDNNALHLGGSGPSYTCILLSEKLLPEDHQRNKTP